MKPLAVPSQVTPPIVAPEDFFRSHGEVKPATWAPGAPKTLACEGRKGVQEAPGLFWYSGFGYGTLYLPGGTTVWCGTSRAAEYCKLVGLVFRNEDPLSCYHGTYLGD